MRQIAGCLILFLLVPFVSATALPQSDQSSGQQAGASSPAKTPSQDNAAQQTSAAPSQPETYPNSPGSVRPQATENGLPFVGQSSTLRDQQAQEPVGTAAAGSVDATGVAASKPAGAAIAPAKQRRTRALLIKVGAVVGAGVAIGTVAALSNASPSRPPGAR
jgi:hypothetical protein